MTADIKRAVEILQGGGLVAFPTETVYGLGADALNPEAVARIFQVKGRPATRPLTVHLGPHADFSYWTHWSKEAEVLAKHFWPGPLTLVLPRKDTVPDIITGGFNTVGLRVPNHPMAITLLDAYGGGVAAPSANRSGQISPTSARAVSEGLGNSIDLILDGGECQIGLESTVLSLVDGPVVLRPGATSIDAIQKILSAPIVESPKAATSNMRLTLPLLILTTEDLSVRLSNITDPVGILSFEKPSTYDSTCMTWIKASTSPTEYLRKLYGLLGQLDRPPHRQILIEASPTSPEWQPIMRRLTSLTSPH